MGVLEELRQIDEEKRRGGNPSSPSVSATSKLEELRSIDTWKGYPTTEASGKELAEPIKRAGKKFLDANVEQLKKDALSIGGIVENVAEQTTALGAGLVNFVPSIPGRIPAVKEKFPSLTKFLDETVEKSNKLLMYAPKTEKGKAYSETINTAVSKVVGDFSENFAKIADSMVTTPDSKNAQAVGTIAGEVAFFALGSKLYGALKESGLSAKEAKRVVDYVVPKREGRLPSKGLPAEKVKLAPFDPDQVKMDLEKVTFSKVKEEIPVKGSGEVKIIGDDATGYIRDDIRPNVVVLDVDGTLSKYGQVGFDEGIVKEINKIIGDRTDVDIVLSSTHRQDYLIERLLGKGDDFSLLDAELQKHGMKGRIGGVTPDLGADGNESLIQMALDRGEPIPKFDVTRGTEVLAPEKLINERGGKIVAVLDNRIDLAELGDRFIHTPEGMTTEHFQKLGELLSPKKPSVGELVKEIGDFDPLLKEHTEKVGRLTIKVAEKLGIPHETVKELWHGALVHDIGKTRLPKDVLNAPRELTSGERELVNKHTTLADDELGSLTEIEKAIVHEHHNVKGISSQIVSLADQYEALTTKNRTYRTPMSDKELYEHFEKQKDKYDDGIFNAFMEEVGLDKLDTARLFSRVEPIIKANEPRPELLSLNETSIFDILKNERGSFSTEKREPSAIAQELKDRVEARKRIVEEYKKVEKEAKESKLKVEEVLRDKGLSPSEIRDFIREGRDATRPLATSVTMKRVREIEKELGFDRKQSAMFNKLVTGLRNPGEMSVAEREMVLSGLEMLYKMKHGEEYHFRVNPKVARAVAQKDANRAFVVKSLSPRGWFGVKEVGNRLVASRFDYLRSHGEGSKILAEKLSDIRTMSDLRYANFRKSAKDITKTLTEEEKVKVQEILDTTNYSDIDRLLEPKHIKDAVRFFKDSFNSIAEDMVALGVEIKKLDGSREFFSADLDAPYWPRMYDPAKILQPGKRHDLILQRMIEKGYAKTVEQAEESLIKRLSERKKTATNGHLEYDREFDVPGYETDLFGVFDTYMKSATLRLEVIKNFKQDNEILNNLLGRIKLEDSQFVHDYALDTVQKMLDPSIKDPVAENIVRAITASQVITKMGSSGIRNLGQVANTIGTSYTKSVVRAIGKTLNKMGRDEAIDFAERAAALLHSYADDFIRFDKGEAVDITLVEKVADKLEWGADKVLTFNAHKRGELGLRVFTANVAREYAADLFKELKTSPMNSRSYKMAKMRLEKLGLDPIELLKKEELSQGDRYKAAYSMVRETQFVNDVLTLPKWARGDNPWLRLLYQFKTFGIHQGRLVARTLRTDPVMSAKLLTTMGVFGAMTAETIDMLQAKVRDDETLLQQVSRYIVSGGGFGVWADTVMESLRSANGLTRALAGPTLDQAQKDITALQKGLVDGDWEMFWNNRKKDIPLIGRRVYNISNE